MSQKKAKPAAKGKSGSDKVHAKTPAKAAAPKSNVKAAATTKPAVKSAPAKPVATKAASAGAAKKPVAPQPTIKKPASAVKLSVVPVAPKAPVAAKSAPKVDMPHVPAKKAELAKAPAAKVAVPIAKPAMKVVAPAPAKQPIAAPDAKAAPALPAGKPAIAPAIKSQPTVPLGVAAKPGVIAVKAPIAAPVAAAAPSEPKKPVSARHGFKTGEWIVYPAQGVGRIVAIEEQEIAGMKLELFVITFEKDKMTLRVPTGKAATVGMRKLAEDGVLKRAMETLKGKARIKRTMWSRRAQEFEAKINSGDLVSVAEVVRDLYRAESQPEQSYSERLLFERALDRMARELAAVEKLDERGAAQRIVEVLSKSAKARRPVTEGEAAAAASDDDGDEATAAA